LTLKKTEAYPAFYNRWGFKGMDPGVFQKGANPEDWGAEFPTRSRGPEAEALVYKF